jgi:hypothetical protein
VRRLGAPESKDPYFTLTDRVGKRAAPSPPSETTRTAAIPYDGPSVLLTDNRQLTTDSSMSHPDRTADDACSRGIRISHCQQISRPEIASYQGMTLVMPNPSRITLGFSPCADRCAKSAGPAGPEISQPGASALGTPPSNPSPGVRQADARTAHTIPSRWQTMPHFWFGIPIYPCDPCSSLRCHPERR